MRVSIQLYHTILIFNNPEEETFNIIMEKGENAGNQHFLYFAQVFLLCEKHISCVELYLMMLFANALNLDKAKVWSTKKFLYDNR